MASARMIENTWIKVDDLLDAIEKLRTDSVRIIHHNRTSPQAYRQQGEIDALNAVLVTIESAPLRRSYLVPRDLTPEDLLEPDPALTFPTTTEFLDLSSDEPEPDIEMGLQERRRARRTPRVRDDEPNAGWPPQ